MISVDLNSKTGLIETVISAHCEEELRENFISLLGAISQRSDILLIFLEEFNNKSTQIQEELIKKW